MKTIRNSDRKEIYKKHHWKFRLHEIIYEADTKEGKAFDIVLMLAICLSIIVVMLDSIDSIKEKSGNILLITEYIFTGLFTLEYILRIMVIKKPSSYILSFYGIIDLMSILPTYISLLLPGGQYFLVLRTLRLLRIFRVLKLVRFIGASKVLINTLRASVYKIAVFTIFVLTIVIISGSMMYLIEGPEKGFSSIPRSIYWAIVTLTTVGYGDIAPATVLGQFFASIIMLTGYAIIAVPTGIITVELSKASQKTINTQVCRHCNKTGHDNDARFCKYCGKNI